VTTIGVLALQGDFAEHQAALRRLGVEARQVRTPEALRDLDGLILPGGESTTFCRLMKDFAMYEPLSALVQTGFPLWGTCAGLIVLAKRVSDLDYPTLEALDVTVRRNAYGRQVDSFEADLTVPALAGDATYHGVFIRAPVVEEVGAGVDVLAELPPEAGEAAGSPVALRQGPFLATAFHPELTADDRFHAYFLDIVREHGRGAGPK
jgi:5'-phosphate synthase pdxT subunit